MKPMCWMDCAPREAITFLQLKTKTEALAEGLLKLGLKPGDFVLISGISCINWIITDLACATIGIHTIRCRMSVLTKEGLLSITNHNNVKAIFYHPGENGEFEKHLLTCNPDAFSNSADQNILCPEIPRLKNVISLVSSEVASCVNHLFINDQQADKVKALKTKVQCDDLLTVFITSGSTGVPKAIPYSHFMVINGLRHTRCFKEECKEDDKFLTIDHCLGLVHLFIYLCCLE